MPHLPIDPSAIPEDSRFFGNVHHLDSIDSTNRYARDRVRAGDHQLLVLAEAQTLGKGRLGRTWLSPKHEGLWMTLVVENRLDVAETFLYTFFAALVISESIERVCRVKTDLKWPNDVMIDCRKVSGILIELVDDHVLLGVGVNCNQVAFPDELRGQAVSLQQATGTPVSRQVILNEILQTFEAEFGDMRPSLMETWISKSSMFGQKIWVQEGNETYQAVAVDVSKNGGLIISRGETTMVLYAADVKILGDSDYTVTE